MFVITRTMTTCSFPSTDRFEPSQLLPWHDRWSSTVVRHHQATTHWRSTNSDYTRPNQFSFILLFVKTYMVFLSSLEWTTTSNTQFKVKYWQYSIFNNPTTQSRSGGVQELIRYGPSNLMSLFLYKEWLLFRDHVVALPTPKVLERFFSSAGYAYHELRQTLLPMNFSSNFPWSSIAINGVYLVYLLVIIWLSSEWFDFKLFALCIPPIVFKKCAKTFSKSLSQIFHKKTNRCIPKCLKNINSISNIQQRLQIWCRNLQTSITLNNCFTNHG